MNRPKNYKLELYHDILARKVYDRASREDKLRLQIERLVRDKYNFYQSGQGGLLTKDELSLINTYRETLSIPAKYDPYIRDSEKAIEREEKKEVRRLRYLLLGAVLAVILIGLLAIWALQQQEKARKNAGLAIAKERDERRARLRADSLLAELGITYDNLATAKAESDTNAAIARRNALAAERSATQATRAKQAEAAEKERAVRKSIAYRLLGLALEQRLQGNLEEAFQIARRAGSVSPDSALTEFRFETYNKLPASEKMVSLRQVGNLAEAFLSPEGTQVLCLIEGGAGAELWNWKTGERRSLSPGPPVKSGGFSHDGSLVYLATEKEVQVLDARTGQASESFNLSTPVQSAFFSTTHSLVLTYHADGRAQVRQLPGGQLLQTYSVGKEVRSAHFKPASGGDFLTVSYQDGVRLWQTGSVDGTPFPTDTWPAGAIFSPNGRYLLIRTIGNQLWLYETQSRRLVCTMQHKAPINSIVFSQDGRHILSASNDETVRIWGLDGTLQTTLYHGIGPDVSIFVKKAVFSEDETAVITYTEGTNGSKSLFYWSRDGQRLARYELRDEVVSLLSNRDGPTFMTATAGGELTVWKTFTAHTESFPEVSLVEIDQMGYELPLAYWLEAAKPDILQRYAAHFAAKSDNFKRPEEHLDVLQKAATLYEAMLRERPLAELPDNTRLDINQVYGNLSWNQLLTGRFRAAERSALRAYEVYPEKEWAKTNLALAYVLTGRFHLARPIYLSLQGRRFDLRENDQRDFETVFLQDLADLEAADIDHPDFARVRALLKADGE